MNNETKGLILIFICMIVSGLFPVVGKYAMGRLHPLFFSSVSALVCAGFIFLFLLVRGEVQTLFGKDFRLLFLIGLFGTGLSSLFFFYGTRLTSGINSALLLQIEPIYSLLLGYFMLKERISGKQILLTLVIIAGVTLVIYNGTFVFNRGDFLILLTPLFWQLCHAFAKKALVRQSFYVIAASRTLFGGLFLLAANILVGRNDLSILDLNLFLLILFQGVVVYAMGFLTWYSAIRWVNLSKGTTIAAPYPILSVIFAWLFLGEVPTMYHLAGLVLILSGALLLSRIRSEKR
jgi:drug/metabolite transporter (DMT)-like permease